jgi:arylsulfatase A-like enzyme
MWVVAATLLALIGIQGGLWLQERIAMAKVPAASPRCPNIILIVIDALRADHLSCYGYSRPTSPNLDRLAKEGVMFENAFAASSWSLPSHASLFTGRYPYEHTAGWTRPKALLNGHHLTLAEALRSQGYRTAAFSANVFWVTREQGLARGFIHFEDYFHSIADMVLRTLYGRVIEKYLLQTLGFEDIPARKRASDVNRSVLHWLDRDDEKPFFVFLNYMDTHDPYLPPQPYYNKFSKFKNPSGILNWRVGRNNPQMTPQQLQSEIDAYDASIAYVDDHIGQLLAELQSRGLGQNTLVVITSDHGEALGNHDLFLHGNSLYLEEIHVPLIFRLTRQLPAGVQIVQPVTNAALPVTVMNLIGASDQTPFPGISLTQLWEASETHRNWPEPLSEVEQVPWAPQTSPAYNASMKSLVNSQWHYIIHDTAGTELYNWKSDPWELYNLAERPEMLKIVASFRSKFP